MRRFHPQITPGLIGVVEQVWASTGLGKHPVQAMGSVFFHGFEWMFIVDLELGASPLMKLFL